MPWRAPDSTRRSRSPRRHCHRPAETWRAHADRHEYGRLRTGIVAAGSALVAIAGVGLETELLDRVARNDLDMAVVAGELSTADLRAVPLAADRLVAVCAPGLAPGRRPAGPRARPGQEPFLREATWILREPGSDTRRQVDRWFERQKFAPAGTLVLTGPDAVKRAAGLGIGILSARCVGDELRRGRLVEISVTPGLPARRYCIVDHRHKHHGAACRAMLAELDRFRASASGAG